MFFLHDLVAVFEGEVCQTSTCRLVFFTVFLGAFFCASSQRSKKHVLLLRIYLRICLLVVGTLLDHHKHNKDRQTEGALHLLDS